MSDVLFKECTNLEYSSITPDNNTFYHCTDGNNVYLGTTELSRTTDVSINGHVLCLGSTTLFNNYSCSQIAKIVQSGQAENYLSVGDTTNLITFNGTLDDYLTFDDYKCKAILIGFNHNKDLETNGKDSITLQFGQDENGVNICFVDSVQGVLATDSLNMNLTATNEGGWESSYMRNNICPRFLELLPGDLQNAIGIVTKYTDNVGGGSNSVSNITATQDKVFLLNYYEVGFTSSGAANTNEADYTESYSEIYSNNSDRRKYKFTANGSAQAWWLRSASSQNSSSFRVVSSDGSGNSSYSANQTLGFVPAIVIY